MGEKGRKETLGSAKEKANSLTSVGLLGELEETEEFQKKLAVLLGNLPEDHHH